MKEPQFTPVALVSDVPPGTKKAVKLGPLEILLCHTGGRVFAIENLCSHAEQPMDLGRMGDCWISCPIHGARFDLATGEPMNPPANQPIQTFAVRIHGDAIEVAA